MKTRGPKSGNPKTLPLRRKMRREMSPAESAVWLILSRKKFQGIKFRRQHAIGNYIVDFYCPSKKLIIEIDGDTHAGEVAVKKD